MGCLRSDVAPGCAYVWQWLEAASATGIKLFLILDGIDLMSHAMSSDDPIGFLPKSMPEGIRCILTTGPGNALTSLAQRGCGAITIWPMDEKQVCLASAPRTVLHVVVRCARAWVERSCVQC